MYMPRGNTIDVEAIINEYGEDYDWVQDLRLIAQIQTSGYDISSYASMYEMWTDSNVPWATDQVFPTEWPETHGVTPEEYDEFILSMLYAERDSEFFTLFHDPQDDWIPLEDRFTQTFRDFFYSAA